MNDRNLKFRALHFVVAAIAASDVRSASTAFAQDQLLGASPVAVRMAAEVSPDGSLAPRIDNEFYRRIRPHARVRLEQFPLTPQGSVDLDLEQFTITNATTKIVNATANGDELVPHPEVALFRGRIVGEPDSFAFLGLSPSGSNGFIRKGPAEYTLASFASHGNRPGGRRHVVFERSASELAGREVPFQCQTSSIPDDTAPTAAAAIGTYSWRVAYVAIDCDYEYGQLFDNLSDAAVYAIELLGAISSIYERDLQVRLHLPFLRIWSTANDPYSQDNVSTLLSELQSEWVDNMGWVDRDIVHLLSGEPGRAGLANVNVLCDENFGYGVSAGLIGAFPRPVPPNDSGPVDTFDLKIVAHEMGHQFGSPHTHCYSPPIDYCGKSFDDCWSGTFQCQQGTIMSYCDRTDCAGIGGGKDLRFHDRVITRIRQSIDASCLRSGLDPVYIDWANNTGVETGSSQFPFNTVLESVEVVIPGGTLQIDAGVYPEGFVANRPMIFRTTGGSVVIGP